MRRFAIPFLLVSLPLMAATPTPTVNSTDQLHVESDNDHRNKLQSFRWAADGFLQRDQLAVDFV